MPGIPNHTEEKLHDQIAASMDILIHAKLHDQTVTSMNT